MKSLEEVMQQGTEKKNVDNSLCRQVYKRTKKRYKNTLKSLANK